MIYSKNVVQFAILFFIVVLIMTNVSGPIPYQSSYCLTNNGSCSNVFYCTCASAAGGEPICTEQMNCDYAAECDVNDACVKDNSTCVIDPRCPEKCLCYSIDLFSPELCPPFPS